MGMLYELDEVEKAAVAGTAMQTRHEHDYRTVEGQSVPQCECGAVRDYDDAETIMTRNLLADMHNDQSATSLTTLRAAILDVIDAGCQHADGFTHEWKFNAFEEDFANAQRCAFVDAVAARVKVLQGEPHGYDAVLLARLVSAQGEFKRGYAAGREDVIESIAKQFDGLTEVSPEKLSND